MNVQLLRRHGPGLLALAVSVAALGFLLATSQQPLRLNWGDPWSDVDIRNAGHFFAKYGFWKTRFAGIVDVEPLTADSYRYLHYPPLGMLINGVVQSVFGTDSLPLARIGAISFSAASLWFFYGYVSAVFGRATAGYAAAIMAGNALWLKYADCIYSHPLQHVFGFGCLFGLARWISGAGWRNLVFAGIAAFLCFFSSYDFYFFLPIAVVLTPPLMGCSVWASRARWATLVIAAFCVAAVAVKCALAVWAIGYDAFAADVRLQFFERATAKYTFEYASSLPRIAIRRFLHFFSPTFFVVAAVYGASLAAKVARMRRPVWMPGPAPLVLLLAGSPFVIAMNQLFAEQFHPSLSFLPFFAVGTGALVAQLIDLAPLALRLAGVVAVAIPLGWSVSDLWQSPKMFLREEALVPVREYLAANDQNSYLYSNLAFSASIRYSLGRQLFPTTHLTTAEFRDAIWGLQTELGVRDVFYVHFDGMEQSVGDCKIGAYAAASWKRPDWLEDPWSSRPAMEEAVRARDLEHVPFLADIATPVLRSPGVTLHRIELARFYGHLAKALREVPEVTFGDATSAPHVLRGFGAPEGGPDGFRWLRPFVGKRLVLTATGLVFVPVVAHHLGEVLVRAAPENTILEVRVWGSAPNEHLHVAVNDRVHLGDIALERAFQQKVVRLEVPAGALDPSGVQKVTFTYGTISEVGAGPGLQSMRFLEPSAAR